MKRSALVLLLLSIVAAVNALNRTAFYRDGFDVIDLDYPTYVHELHYNWANNHFYAFGSGQWRQINHGPLLQQFEAVDNFTLFPYDQNFIDVRLVTPNNTQELWAIGPVFQQRWQENGTVGYALPVTVVPPHNNATFDFAVPADYTFYSVSIDDRNKSNTLVYLVGWGPGGGDAVDFVVVRARMSLTTPFGGITIDTDAGDVCFLHANAFHPYHATYKPRIIHDYSTNNLFIISPNFLQIYRVSAPSSNQPLSKADVLEINAWGPYVGSSFSWYQDKVYLGFANTYLHNAQIVEIDLPTFKVARRMEFPTGNHTNPRAIVARNSTIYVGFEGGPSITKIDAVNWRILGYATLPTYLHTVYAGWDEGYEHVYFITHEERSKIFRINKQNFCPQVCPYNGYCHNAVCQCDSPYTLVGDQYNPAGRCEYIAPTTQTVTKEEKGAAIAMGILWALTMIAAAAGWYLFYKAKNGGYQRVL